MAGALRQQITFPLRIQRPSGENPIRLQHPGNLARPFPGNAEVIDALDHRGSVFVQNPVVFVLRVRSVAVGWIAQVLAAGASGFQNGPNLFACIFGVKIVKYVADWRKIVRPSGAVHPVIDGDKAHIVARKNDFRILADKQIISAKSAHVLNDPSANQALLHEGKALLDTGTIEVRPGVPIVYQNAGICEAVVGGISEQNVPLIGDGVTLGIKGILITETAVQNRDFMLIHVVFSFLLWVS